MTTQMAILLALLVFCSQDRAAVPDAAALKEVEKLVKEVFKDDYAKKGTADRQALARKLLQQAGESKDDANSRYVLLKESRTLATDVGDSETALKAVDEISKLYLVDGIALKQGTLSTLALAAKTPAELKSLATALIQLADEAAVQNNFEAAEKAAAAAVPAAQRAKDIPLVSKAQAKAKETGDLKSQYEKVRKALEKLGSSPDDPAANGTVGHFLCLVKGDWEAGLPHLRKGDDAALKALAEQDLARPTDARAQAALGEAWAAHAAGETAIGKARARERAAGWLGRAIPGLTGLAKVAAEKKLASLGPVADPEGPMTLDLGGGVRMEFVYIKPGTFAMGGTEASTEVWLADNRPEHKVTITRGFHLGKYEVTQAQWEAVTGANPSQWKGPDLPVQLVAWVECQTFLKTLNEKASIQLKGRVAALPTEAQWEYSCQAGTRARWSFGDDESAMGEHAWYILNSGGQPHPVGQKKPNAWGLYDMHGNVWEWCQDWAAPYAGDATDPEGPARGDRRCVRGGSWGHVSMNCRVALRPCMPANNRTTTGGLRVRVQ